MVAARQVRVLLLVLFVFATALTLAGQSQNELGDLGRAVKPTTIYSKPDPSSPAYYKIKEGDYLVLQPAGLGWFKVLLQNGNYGYVAADKVKSLPYKVTSSKGLKLEEVTLGQKIVDFALARKQTPAVAGGTNIETGIGNVAFVQAAFEGNGIKIPSSIDGQLECGQVISRLEDLKPGDRLYFSCRGKATDTVGIFVGNGHFVFADEAAKTIRTQYLDKKWLKFLNAARRGGPKA